MEDLGRLNPDDPKALARWQQLFSQIANANVNTGWTDATDSIGKQQYPTGQGHTVEKWFANLHRGGTVLEAIHEAGHLMFSPFDHSQAVSIKLNDSRIKHISNAIEDVRIERLVDVWYGTKVYDWHQNELANDGNTLEQRKALVDLHLGNAILDEVYGLGTPLSNPLWQDAINHFQTEIHAATKSPDPMASVNLAIEIAAYLKWAEEQQPPDDPGDPGDGDDEEGEEGEGEGGSGGDGEGGEEGDGSGSGSGSGSQPGDGDTPTDQGQPGGNTGQSEPNEAKNHVYIGSYGPVGGGDNPDLPDQAPPPMPDDLKAAIKDAMDSGMKEIAKQAKSQARKAEKAEKEQELIQSNPIQRSTLLQGGTRGTDHYWKEVTQPGLFKIELDAHTKVLLDKQDGLQAGRTYYSGRPRTNAWQINYGNTRVFNRPLKTRGKIAVLLDYSGSMGCPCGCVFRDTGLDSNYANNGYIASQIVAAMAASQPGLEVMGFGGNGMGATLTLHPGELRPPCWNGHDSVKAEGMSGGTPLCTALMGFGEWLSTSGNLTGATALVITDGSPNNCYDGAPKPTGSDPRPITDHHVFKLTHEMAQAGINFGVICIGGDRGQRDLFPPSVTAMVNKLSELDQIQPLLDMIQG